MTANYRAIAYALLRLTLGANLFGHGFFRILSGVPAFAHGMANGMSKSPLPHLLVIAFGYAIPFIEATLGGLLFLGLFTRIALAGAAVLMIALTFGVTSAQNWEAAGIQLNYAAVVFVLFWLSDANTLSADSFAGLRHSVSDSSNRRMPK